MQTNTAEKIAHKQKLGHPVLRIAQNTDGDDIAELLQSVGWDVKNVDINWHDIYPYWIIAEQDGVFIGCIQTLLSRPVGRLEFLAVRPELSHQLQAVTVRALVIGGCATLKANGATLVAGTVPHELKSYKRVLKNRGGVVIGTGSVILKSLV